MTVPHRSVVVTQGARCPDGRCSRGGTGGEHRVLAERSRCCRELNQRSAILPPSSRKIGESEPGEFVTPWPGTPRKAPPWRQRMVPRTPTRSPSAIMSCNSTCRPEQNSVNAGDAWRSVSRPRVAVVLGSVIDAGTPATRCGGGPGHIARLPNHPGCSSPRTGWSCHVACSHGSGWPPVPSSRQPRSGAIQRLHLALLVAAQHQGMLGGDMYSPTIFSSFSTIFGSRETLKVRPCGQSVGTPHLEHRGVRDAQLRGELACAPMRRCRGVVCVVRRTISAASMRGLRPLRGRSPAMAARPPRQTDSASSPPGSTDAQLRAIWRLPSPSAASNTMRARRTARTSSVCDLTRRSARDVAHRSD